MFGDTFIEDEVKQAASLWIRYARWIKIGGSIALVAVVLGWGAHIYFQKPVGPVGQAVEAAATNDLKSFTEEKIPTAPLKAYSGKPAKQKLNLPVADTENPNFIVFKPIEIPADGRRHRVTSGVDTETGEEKKFDEVLKAPFIAFSTKGDATLAGGLDASGNHVALVQVRQEGLRIMGDISVGVLAQVLQTQGSGTAAIGLDSSAMVFVGYNWGR